MTTTSIRINRKAHERLKTIADKEHSTLNDVVEELISRYERDEFRRAVYEGFRGLREDPAEWEAYQEMIRPWDATLLDGLENEPAFDDADNDE